MILDIAPSNMELSFPVSSRSRGDFRSAAQTGQRPKADRDWSPVAAEESREGLGGSKMSVSRDALRTGTVRAPAERSLRARPELAVLSRRDI
jgi:hypothetical protein